MKKNYRPITVLPSVSKIYERMMQDQMLPFVQSFLSPLLCGFREGYGTQHALLHFVETCKKSIDSGGVAGVVLTDLSKAFDCLNHDLLIAKLNAYGFSRSALLFIHSYLTNRKQRVKAKDSGKGQWFIQHMDGNPLGCTAKFSLRAPFVLYISE